MSFGENKLIVGPFIEFTIYSAYLFAILLISSLTKRRDETRRKDAFMHDRAKKDLSRDSTGSGQKRAEANGSYGMLMACNRTFALYLRIESITVNLTAIEYIP